MANIHARKENGRLFYDFAFLGIRCREQTLLTDTKANRKTLERTLNKIVAEIELGCFDFEKYFPHSSNLEKIKARMKDVKAETAALVRRRQGLDPLVPTLTEFAEIWLAENEIRWRTSTKTFMTRHVYQFIVPQFGKRVVSEITRAEILAFRSSLAKVETRRALLRNCPTERSYPLPRLTQDTRIVCGAPKRVNWFRIAART